MSETWTVQRVLVWTAQHFEKKGVDAPRLTADLLLAYALGTQRVRLYMDMDRPLQKDELASFRALIERRVAGEPTAYLIGRQDFYGRTFAVDARVLVPRPETELLVEAVLQEVPKDAPARLAELCTGSGCIAATLGVERPNAQVFATDLSPDACAVARKNVEALGVQARVHVLEGDLLSPLPKDAPFQVVVSNPPYIASGEIAGLSAEVRREPRMALDGGADGLDLVRRIAREAKGYLAPGGLLALEIGETQGAQVKALLEAEGYGGVRVEKDLERRDRHAYGRLPAAEGTQG